MITLIFLIILVALVFDFLNGFHDAANSIATVVSTRVLSTTQAVIWPALFNLLAWLERRQTPQLVDRLFRRLQLLSAALYSLGHGGNDAQKTMGIIVMRLGTAGYAHWGQADPNSFLFHLHLFGGAHNVAWWII